MQEEARWLFSRVGFWESRIPHSDCGVETRIHKMEYPLLVNYAFGGRPEDALEDFKRRFLLLVRKYAVEWIMRDFKERKTRENLGNLFELQSKIDVGGIFKTLLGGEDQASVDIPMGSVRLEMKRFGDCLGVRIVSNNHNKEPHQEGTAMVMEWCQEANHHEMTFLHSIECIIPLPKARGKNNSAIIDFAAVQDNLIDACRYFFWKRTSEYLPKLMEKYISPGGNDMVMIGGWNDIEIGAKLFHYQDNANSKDVQWRRGNILSQENLPCQEFARGDDLCLSLSVLSGLPEHTFLKKIDPELFVWNKQMEMVETWAILYAQLCAMEAVRTAR